MGFTLIELMVVLAVLSITLAIAVPSFQSVIRNSRISSATNEVLAAMNFARQEAIRRNTTVRYCISTDSGAWVAENSTANVVGTGIRSGSLPPSIVIMPSGLDTGTVADHACVRFRPDGTASDTGKLTLRLGDLERAINVEVGVLNATD